MARKRRGQPVHGWLGLDKPPGMTSTTALSAVKRRFDAAKAGHGGTLDPLATGVLPIAFGEATKTVSWVMDGSKRYRFTVRWGQATATDDCEGGVTEASDVRPDAAAIAAALPAFRGEIEQVPPAFSAIKVDGRRAYDLARGDRAVALAARRVRIDQLDLLGQPDADHADFAVSCGKGTYVRALGRDLARSLGTVGHIVALRRTRVGPFDEADAISLEKLDRIGHTAALIELLLPIDTVLDDIPALVLSDLEANRLRCGQSVSLLRRSDLVRHRALDQSGAGHGALVRAMADGRFVGLVRREAGVLHPVRILNR